MEIVFIHLAHNRTETLRRALQQTCVDVVRTTGIHTRVLVLADRPTSEVRDVVMEFPIWALEHVRLPVRSAEHGEQFTAARQQALDIIDQLKLRPDWIAFMDDDWELGPGWQDHLRDCLQQPHMISWRGQVLFFWTPTKVNLRQHHCSPFFVRYKSGWRMKPDMILHIPEPAWELVQARPELEATLPFYILDRGTINEEERKALFRECARAGKLDAYTRAYIEPPNLLPVEEVLRRWPCPQTLGT